MQSSSTSEVQKSDQTLTSSDGLQSLAERPSPKRATAEDIEKLVEFGEKFHQLSPWRDTPYIKEKVALILGDLIKDPDSVVFISDSGAIGGTIDSLFFNHVPVAQELFWYAEENGADLKAAFEWWAYEEGAEGVSMASTSERAKALARVYKSSGYEPREIFYYKGFEE